MTASDGIAPSERALALAREFLRQEEEPGWHLQIDLPNGSRVVQLWDVTRGAALKALEDTALRYPMRIQQGEYLRVSLWRHVQRGPWG